MCKVIPAKLRITSGAGKPADVDQAHDRRRAKRFDEVVHGARAMSNRENRGSNGFAGHARSMACSFRVSTATFTIGFQTFARMWLWRNAMWVRRRARAERLGSRRAEKTRNSCQCLRYSHEEARGKPLASTSSHAPFSRPPCPRPCRLVVRSVSCPCLLGRFLCTH